MNIVEQYIRAVSFSEIRNRYSEFPKISFDYEVAEKAKLVAVVPFFGKWKDLGTWNTLTDELEDHVIGNVITDGETENTHIINELDLPIMCIGTKDLVIAASNDGILISEKSKSENIKNTQTGYSVVQCMRKDIGENTRLFIMFNIQMAFNR